MTRALILSLGVGLATAPGVARADDFYYANGKQIPLVGSNEYVGYRIKPDAALSTTTTRRLVAKVHRKAGDPAVVVAKAASLAVRSLDADLQGDQEKVEDRVPVFVVETVPSIVTDQVIVRFKEGVPELQIRAALGDLEAAASPDAAGKYIVKVRGDHQETIRVANAFARNADLVRYAQPNFTYIVPQDTCHAGEDVKPSKTANTAPSTVAPNSPTDPYFDRQWGLQNSGGTGKAGADIRIAGGWLLPDGKGR